tara:strand:- start:446 stop:676 length:231 start_codon:yes stop_codon:yes gene_type:complete
MNNMSYKNGSKLSKQKRSERIMNRATGTLIRAEFAMEKGQDNKASRLLKKAAKQENRSINVEDREMGRPKFKPLKK